MWAKAQNNAQSAAPPPLPVAAADCPKPADVNHLHLYGAWRAEWSDAQAPTELRLGRHPEMAQSVRGTMARGAVQVQVVGDVDDGDFTLEESDNGRSISATWTGRVVEGSCGKEIKGTWNNAKNTQELHFVLRKQPGWR